MRRRERAAQPERNLMGRRQPQAALEGGNRLIEEEKDGGIGGIDANAREVTGMASGSSQ